MASQDEEPLPGSQTASPEQEPSKSAEADGGSGGNVESTARKVLAEHSAQDQGRTLPAGMKALIVFSLATFGCIGLHEVSNLFGPAFFALTLVLTVRPIHRWLIRKGLPPWLSAIFTMTALFGFLLGMVGLTVWSLIDLPDTLKSYSGSFKGLVQNVVDLAEKYNLSSGRLSKDLLDNLDFDKIVTAVTTVLEYLTSAGSLLGMISLSMLFITVDTMTMKFRSKIVYEHDSHFHDALEGFEGRVRQYWIVSSIFGAIVAVVNGIVLAFLHVPMPAAWAIFSFVTNYIPNIGFVIGLVPPALMGLLDSGWLTALWVVIAYSVINSVIQGIFQPKITGDAVGLSTTVTFLSLLFWTVVIGPLGAILAVPLTLFAKALLIDSSVQTRWLEVFIIPESEAKERYDSGFYDVENPTDDDFVDFMSAELDEHSQSERPKTGLRRSKVRLGHKSAPESGDSGGSGSSASSSAKAAQDEHSR